MKERNTIKIFNENIVALIDLNDGLNVNSIKKDDIELIYYDEQRYRNGNTYGVPILYPSPNRVYNNHFYLNDEKIKMNIHGFLLHHTFELIEHKNNYLKAKVDIIKENYAYELFPIESSIIVKIEIIDNSITWEFQITNNDNKDLQFGLALHPFFNKQFTSLKTNIDKIMEMDLEKYPTGNLINIEETKFNFRDDIELINNVDVDHVFFKNGKIISELIEKKVNIKITSSKEFNHQVIYTKQGSSFICIEPQTSSTDCHNLYNKGFKKESNLITIKSNDTFNGYIRFKLE